MNRSTIDLSSVIDQKSMEYRFWCYVQPADADECWQWIGTTDKGYGHLSVTFIRDGERVCRPAKAHRIAWYLLRGEIVDGLEIDHLCRNPPCVNPWHMDLVTHSENMRRRPFNQHTGKTHCKHGHEFSAENTYVLKSRRYCRTCMYRRIAEYRARKRERVSS